jgi:hypothetical protein
MWEALRKTHEYKARRSIRAWQIHQEYPCMILKEHIFLPLSQLTITTSIKVEEPGPVRVMIRIVEVLLYLIF